MKQRITPNQLNELSDSQKIALRGWFLSKFPITRGGEIPWVNTKPPLPLMTIGQMIEFLSDLQDNGDKECTWLMLTKGEIRWYVGTMGSVFENIKGIYVECPELCDALWGTVKAKLPKKGVAK